MVTMARSLMTGRWGKRNVASLPSAEADGQGGMSFAREPSRRTAERNTP
jgi:hypothetical protein